MFTFKKNTEYFNLLPNLYDTMDGRLLPTDEFTTLFFNEKPMYHFYYDIKEYNFYQTEGYMFILLIGKVFCFSQTTGKLEMTLRLEEDDQIASFSFNEEISSAIIYTEFNIFFFFLRPHLYLYKMEHTLPNIIERCEYEDDYVVASTFEGVTYRFYP